MMNSEEELIIEVACATPSKQCVIEIRVARQTTVAEAIELSDIKAEFPDLDMTACKVGIYGEIVSPNLQLKEGDRVEIYRELLFDPKQVRLNRAAASGHGSSKQRGNKS